MPGCKVGDIAMIKIHQQHDSEKLSGKIVEVLEQIPPYESGNPFAKPGIWWNTTSVLGRTKTWDTFHDDILFPLKPLSEDEEDEFLIDLALDENSKFVVKEPDHV